MDVPDDTSLDFFEGYEEAELPWALDIFKDWQEFVRKYGQAAARQALDVARLQWPPSTLAFDLTTKCNLRCPMCQSNGDEIGREKYTKRQMDWRVIADFIIRSGGVRTVSIGSLGENLIKRDTLEFMEAVKDHVTDFAFSTNATALTPEYIADLARFNVTSIRISCDAGDPLSYPIWRRGGDYETFAANSRELARVFGDRVALHSVLFRENLETMSTVPEFARNLGLGKVEIHALRRKDVAIRSNLHCANLKETIDYFNAVLPRAEAIGVEVVPIIAFPDGLSSRVAWERTGGRIGNRDFTNEVSAGLCTEPWRFLYVSHNGEICPCCGGYEGEKVDGNPFEMDPDSLLNIRSHLLLRAMTLAGVTPSVCQFYCRKCYGVGGRKPDSRAPKG
jgi:MoaA/NifB/PqqE/SkfB family radical SAM enzyme